MKGNLKVIYGTLLREYRTQKGLTQQELADYLGMDRAYISELERGLLMPSLETFFRITRQLNIKAKDFIDRIDEEL